MMELDSMCHSTHCRSFRR